MTAQTKIEWADSTVNFWRICTPVGPGCDHCYAGALSKRTGGGEYASGVPRKRTSAKYWRDALKMAQRQFYECRSCGWRGDRLRRTDFGFGGAFCCPNASCAAIPAFARRRIFALSLGDWLDNEVPIEMLVDALDVIRRSPQSDWLLLTKRIGNWHKRITEGHQHVVRKSGRSDLGWWLQEWLAENPPANVWIGATVVNQDEADRDVPKLLRVPARVRFLSIEPILGSLVLDPSWITRWPNRQADVYSIGGVMLDWVICGGESGPHARPMHPAWVRSLRDQCAAAGVPFLFKQWGEWAPDDHFTHVPHRDEAIHEWLADDGMRVTERSWRYGKKAAGRLLEGREHNGFPAVSA